MDVTVRKSALGRRSFRSPFHALFTMGQVRPMLARASKEVKFAMVPAIKLPGNTVLPISKAPALIASRFVRCAVVMATSGSSDAADA